MKGFKTLLLIVVAAFAAYTYWQVMLLQKEVTGLKAHAARSASREPVTVTENKEASRLVAQARKRCWRAQVYMERGQTRKAKQELNLCLQELNKASDLSDDNKKTPDLNKGWQEIKRQVDKLWKEFAQEAKPQKGK